jgi:hypothetical protein
VLALSGLVFAVARFLNGCNRVRAEWQRLWSPRSKGRKRPRKRP